MSALYIHIPFCKKTCTYCDFYKKCAPDDNLIDSYPEALFREMEFRRDFIDDKNLRTIYFGGGTPSIYSPKQIQDIIDKAASVWDLSGVTEITLEMNPDDVTPQYMAELASTRVNRLSMGIQSFIDRDLQMLNRRHSAQQAKDAVKMARENGFNNISIDLMYGIPGQNIREWEKNLVTAISLGVEHISAYGLTIEEGTPIAKTIESGYLEQATEAEYEEQFLMAHNILTDAGFDHYEISNYAAGAEKRSAHNCNYWCGESYLGLGPSAHSYDGNQRSSVVSSVKDYLSGAGADQIYGREILTRTDKYNEFVMTSLRTCCGVKRDIMTQKFGLEGLLYFEYTADKFIQQGLLVRDGNEYRIPPEKFMVSDAIIRELFYEEEE